MSVKRYMVQQGDLDSPRITGPFVIVVTETDHEVELAKYRLRWTEEKPTVEGWYWYKLGQEETVMWIPKEAINRLGILSPNGRWAGPIILPGD